MAALKGRVLMNTQKASATLTVTEVRDILKIGSNSVYSLIHSKAFPVIKIGHSYRVPSKPFYVWLNGRDTEVALPEGVDGNSSAAI